MSKTRKTYHSIGEVCEELDLPASTIRYWETRFSCLNPRKNAKGTRYYTPEDLNNLRLIYHLVKEKKMTLPGAETFMMQRRVAAKSEMSVVEILQRIRATFQGILQEIETAENATRKSRTSATVVSTNEQEFLEIAEVSDPGISGGGVTDGGVSDGEISAEKPSEKPNDDPDYPFTQLELF